jgi:hypothetical protein
MIIILSIFPTFLANEKAKFWNSVPVLLSLTIFYLLNWRLFYQNVAPI